MQFRKMMIATALAASATIGLPSAAYAGDDGWHRGDRHYGHYDRRYDRPRRCKTSGTTGLILGGAVGALLGREIDRYGDRAPGTIIGAGAGALLGREIARKNRC